MKTKNIISLALFVAIGMTGQAQIVSSRSDQMIVTKEVKVKEKKPRTPWNAKWFLKTGCSLDNMVNANCLSSIIGYDISFGFVHPMKNNINLGGEIGIMSFGTKLDNVGNAKGLDLFISPNISTKILFLEKMTISPFIGPYISYALKSENIKDYNGNYWQGVFLRKVFDYGINIGAYVGLSKNWFLDVHYKRGFAKKGGCRDAMSRSAGDEWVDVKTQKIVFGIGYEF